MAISRYDEFDRVVDKITGKPRLETFPAIRATDLIDERNDIIIEFTEDMRLDGLAFQYLGDGRYWWAICLLNDISLPFGDLLPPGKLLRIPTNISRILNIIEFKINQV